MAKDEDIVEKLAAALRTGGYKTNNIPYDNELEKLDHAQLLNLRKQFPDDDKDIQNYLSAFEHQAFAREYTDENPIAGSLSLAAATPLYYGAKTLGFMKGRSDPSLRQVARGYQGIGEGLYKHMEGFF